MCVVVMKRVRKRMLAEGKHNMLLLLTFQTGAEATIETITRLVFVPYVIASYNKRSYLTEINSVAV